MATAVLDWAVCLGCSDAGPEHECCILLPHQSPLGTVEDQRYQPTDEWPATFLCLRHGHMCVRSAESVRLQIETLAPTGRPLLWRVVCRCGRESCERMHIIYIGKVPDWADSTCRLENKPESCLAGMVSIILCGRKSGWGERLFKSELHWGTHLCEDSRERWPIPSQRTRIPRWQAVFYFNSFLNAAISFRTLR